MTVGVLILYIVFDEYMNICWGDFENIILITTALPGTSWVTYGTKCLYTCTLFFTYPLQLAPAINLIEGWIFDKNSAPTAARKCQQNVFRTIYVALTIIICILVFR